ncbi:hypothetical protein [Prevotella ihumii]|uniref:hypothetical protein n=1 Tax=Prevotella ihumii TaxID=1917878 RepID=UPI00117E4961|nr:hypothetical protein [Prevotella ihumii]
MLLHHNAVSLHKIGCTRQYSSKLVLPSLALSLHKIGKYRKCRGSIYRVPLIKKVDFNDFIDSIAIIKHLFPH